MTPIPDIEALIGDHLRDEPEIADIVGDRVVGRTPSSTDRPWVRVFQLDAQSSGRSTTDHLVEFYVQLDCFAGKAAQGRRGESSLLTRLVRAAMVAMPEAAHAGAVVSGVRIDGCPRIPDGDFDPPMERYALTATVWAHAVEEGS
jgi:hypothetical protein